MLNIIGSRFGVLVVKEKIREGGRTKYICTCDCGGETTTYSCMLRSGKTKSCGCMKGVKHGFYGTQEYNSWQGMKDRCTNPNNPSYDSYGGRGITVCEEWKKFENFILDMGEKPYDEVYSIERIDNNKGYYKDNCKWGTLAEQNSNKPYPSSTGVRGIQKGREDYPFQVSITINHKLRHFGWFKTIEEAKIKLAEVKGGLSSNQ